MQSENTLLVDSVTLSFGTKQVLSGAYITARTGLVTGVLGRNGTGKSCLFKCIMGGIKPQNIFIRFNEERQTDYRHIGERIKYLPQQTFIPPSMTFGEAFELYGVGYEDLIGFDTIFHSYRNRPLYELSGGAIRIAETYLILHAKAEFCILDEPFSNIAPKYVEKMQRIIDEQKATKGIIISDHLYESVMESTDDLFLMRDGYTFPVKEREDLIRLGYLLR